MIALIRIFAIAIVAMMSGPRVGLAADGEWTVICDGATGEPTLALYDFERGEIIDPVVVIETCGFCYLADTGSSPRAPVSSVEPAALSHDVALSDLEPDRFTVRTADARAPPSFVEA